jgi:hypothetical protein
MDWQINRHMDRQAEERMKWRMTDGLANEQTDRQTDRWKNVIIDGQADRQVGKQTD